MKAEKDLMNNDVILQELNSLTFGGANAIEETDLIIYFRKTCKFWGDCKKTCQITTVPW